MSTKKVVTSINVTDDVNIPAEMAAVPENMPPEMAIMFAKEAEKKRIIERVRNVFPDVQFPDVDSQLLAHYERGTALEDAHLIPKKTVLVGSFEADDGNVQYPYGIVSDQYQLVTHEEMIYNVLDGLKDNAADWGNPEIDIRLWNDGARMKFNIDFPKFHAVEVAIGDPVSLRIAGTNSYDLALEYQLATEAFVLKCMNGMVGTEVLEKYNARHKGNLNIELSKNILGQSAIAFMEQAEIWKTWSKKPLAIEHFQPVFDGLPFGKKQADDILALPIIQKGKPLSDLAMTGKATLWDVNLAVTQYLSHEVESEMVKMRKGAEVSKYLHDVGYEMAA